MNEEMSDLKSCAYDSYVLKTFERQWEGSIVNFKPVISHSNLDVQIDLELNKTLNSFSLKNAI